ncbi:unnamed protein product [Rotaria magnacalcarata]|uniref:G domain-containing protein n=3 Tax=Rotaria magnacalcarata TaxID=392030 RepID=A0A816E5Y7_9BILA|nr:unnamed protein product [Rotaria magnacalcarata]
MTSPNTPPRDMTQFTDPTTTGSGLKSGCGKTTLINQLCDTKFMTSSGEEGCCITDDQVGSFKVSPRQIDLVDMLGVNCQDESEWRKKLSERSDVHGVIFYINGVNNRHTALGEKLRRLAQYCHNIQIKILFLYYFRALNRFDDFGTSFEVTLQTGNDFHITNRDQVKREIDVYFAGETKLHHLLDPIDYCKQLHELKLLLENEEASHKKQLAHLQAELKKNKESHQAELKKNNELHQAELNDKEIKLQQQSMTHNKQHDDLLQQFQNLNISFEHLQSLIGSKDNEIKTLEKTNNAKEQENIKLTKQKTKLENHRMKLEEGKKTLETHKTQLTQWGNHLLELQQRIETHVQKMNAGFHLHINKIADLRDPTKLQIISKRSGWTSKSAWLPLAGLFILNHSDTLCTDLETIMNPLMEDFNKIQIELNRSQTVSMKYTPHEINWNVQANHEHWRSVEDESDDE